MRNFDASPTTERMRVPRGARFAQTTHHRPRNTRRDITRTAAVRTAGQDLLTSEIAASGVRYLFDERY